MTGKRNTSDPTRPAYDNPARDKGEITNLSHGGEPATGQKAKDQRVQRSHQSARPVGHRSDKKLGQKPA